MKLAVIQVTLSFRVSRRKKQLKHKEASSTLRLETADTVTPLQGRRELSLEPGDGRGAVWRKLLSGGTGR